jgi:TNF receptor-associated factor 4
MEEHEKDCEFRPSPCSICTDMVPYKEKDTHSDVCKKRPTQCEYCTMVIPFDEMDHHIKEICIVISLPCPNQCMTKDPIPVMLRDELTLHRKTCLFEPIPCMYSSIGCLEMTKRCEIEKHENDLSIHFPLLYRFEKDQRQRLETEIEVEVKIETYIEIETNT